MKGLTELICSKIFSLFKMTVSELMLVHILWFLLHLDTLRNSVLSMPRSRSKGHTFYNLFIIQIVGLV